MNVNTLSATPMAFYQPSRARIWDYAVMAGGEWRTRFGGQTLVQLREEFPDMTLISSDIALVCENEQFRSPWVEITESRYIDQLEVLPPVDWCRSTAGESFKSMEMYGGDVTTIFARRAGRFFECRDLHTLTHAAIVESLTTTFFAGDSMNTGH
ncbi:hypothetical protein [Metakosakonia massiliensis]|uniref:Uncharacterized protein n=1 Tax=Phytobacter massiliensis TaxID=1485952 RepID=A0A6N3EAI7_9ENTR